MKKHEELFSRAAGLPTGRRDGRRADEPLSGTSILRVARRRQQAVRHRRQTYIDMCLSFGASLLGHRHPRWSRPLAKAGELGVICATENRYQTNWRRRWPA